MDQREYSPPFAFRVAEEIDAVAVSGSYDAEAQLWVGTGQVEASGTTTYSATSCHTTTLSHTNCGMDNDMDYDDCGDYDRDYD